MLREYFDVAFVPAGNKSVRMRSRLPVMSSCGVHHHRVHVFLKAVQKPSIQAHYFKSKLLTILTIHTHHALFHQKEERDGLTG